MMLKKIALIIALTLPAEVVAEEIDRHSWNLNVRQSKLDNVKTTTLFREGNSPYKDGFGRDQIAIVAIACHENTTRILFNSNSFLVDSQIRYRIDDRDVRSLDSSVSSDNKAIGLWRGNQSIPFIKEMLSGHTLVIQIEPYRDPVIEVEFDLTGLPEKIRPIREQCGW